VADFCGLESLLLPPNQKQKEHKALTQTTEIPLAGCLILASSDLEKLLSAIFKEALANVD